MVTCLRRGSARKFLAGLVAFVALMTTFSVGTAAAAGTDYWLYAQNNEQSRWVAHDYHYLRNQNSASPYLCVRRNSSGSQFCAWAYIDKHYVDHCNPASCYSIYGGYDNLALYVPMDIHDEWY